MKCACVTEELNRLQYVSIMVFAANRLSAPFAFHPLAKLDVCGATYFRHVRRPVYSKWRPSSRLRTSAATAGC